MKLPQADPLTVNGHRHMLILVGVDSDDQLNPTTTFDILGKSDRRQTLSYPMALETDDRTLLATSPDFPELTTFGDDREEAVARAVHALEEAIAARIHDRMYIPMPSQGETYAVQEWVSWYREGGMGEVVAHKMGGRGQPRFLSAEQERELTEEVSTGRFRTGGEIRDWIESEYGVSYKPGSVYSLLSRLGCSPKVPRGRHEKADLAAQESWKKGAS